jgi:predicted alpha/beta-hydrolase family hydrolase
MEQFELSIGGKARVSATLLRPSRPVACFVFAHGAGAGMNHPFMAGVSQGLLERDVATLRYHFPYMESGGKRPDRPEMAHQTVRAAVAAAGEKFSDRRFAGLPILAGGKSFGGRMTSQAQALAPMDRVAGLAFFGFPLHPAGKPGIARAEHLTRVTVPMLFLQGTRDALAESNLIQQVVSELGDRATLVEVEQADHSFHVPKRSGRTDGRVLDDLLDAFVAWTGSLKGFA